MELTLEKKDIEALDYLECRYDNYRFSAQVDYELFMGPKAVKKIITVEISSVSTGRLLHEVVFIDNNINIADIEEAIRIA